MHAVHACELQTMHLDRQSNYKGGAGVANLRCAQRRQDGVAWLVQIILWSGDVGGELLSLSHAHLPLRALPDCQSQASGT